MIQTVTASERVAAFGNETRLAVFRLLMRAGSDDISAGVIREKLKFLAPTLSFYGLCRRCRPVTNLTIVIWREGIAA